MKSFLFKIWLFRSITEHRKFQQYKHMRAERAISKNFANWKRENQIVLSQVFHGGRGNFLLSFDRPWQNFEKSYFIYTKFKFWRPVAFATMRHVRDVPDYNPYTLQSTMTTYEIICKPKNRPNLCNHFNSPLLWIKIHMSRKAKSCQNSCREGRESK